MSNIDVPAAMALVWGMKQAKASPEFPKMSTLQTFRNAARTLAAAAAVAAEHHCHRPA